MMVCVFTLSVSACEAKEKVKTPEVKQEEVKPVEQNAKAPKTSPLPQKKMPEPKKSLVIYESSTDGVFIVKIYADNKEVLTDALSYDQLSSQIPKTLENLFKKKEGM